MSEPFRILLTGSRDWDNRPRLAHEMAATASDLAFLRPAVLVHGACPTGADAIAAHEAKALGWTVESHPADWEAPCRAECKPGHRRRRRDGTVYCPAAGNYRNQEMVDTHPDVCLAFFAPGAANTGTSDCVRRAEKAGIPVRRFTLRETT